MRDGDPEALAGLCERRGPAVLAYCEHVAGDGRATLAAAEAFRRFRAAVVQAPDIAGLNPEALLIGATRTVAAEHVPQPPQLPDVLRHVARRPATGWCGDVPVLLAARANRSIARIDLARLEQHLSGCPACRAPEARFDAAERAYRNPPNTSLPLPVAAAIIAALATAAPIRTGPASSAGPTGYPSAGAPSMNGPAPVAPVFEEPPAADPLAAVLQPEPPPAATAPPPAAPAFEPPPAPEPVPAPEPPPAAEPPPAPAFEPPPAPPPPAPAFEEPPVPEPPPAPAYEPPPAPEPPPTPEPPPAPTFEEAPTPEPVATVPLEPPPVPHPAADAVPEPALTEAHARVPEQAAAPALAEPLDSPDPYHSDQTMAYSLPDYADITASDEPIASAGPERRPRRKALPSLSSLSRPSLSLPSVSLPSLSLPSIALPKLRSRPARPERERERASPMPREQRTARTSGAARVSSATRSRGSRPAALIPVALVLLAIVIAMAFAGVFGGGGDASSPTSVNPKPVTPLGTDKSPDVIVVPGGAANAAAVEAAKARARARAKRAAQRQSGASSASGSATPPGSGATPRRLAQRTTASPPPASPVTGRAGASGDQDQSQDTSTVPRLARASP